MRIKVCGMTRKEDVDKCCHLGVDALGFIMAKSPRRVNLDKVRELTEDIIPFINRVVVVVNPEENLLAKIVDSKLFDYIQFHGQEDPDLIRDFPLRTIKAISIGAETPTDNIYRQMRKYEDADYYLFDSKIGRQTGGTGKRFNWNIFNEVKIKKPYILAGGLGIDNILEAMAAVNMQAVDLNSRLEISPGIKNRELLTEAIKIIRDYEK